MTLACRSRRDTGPPHDAGLNPGIAARTLGLALRLSFHVCCEYGVYAVWIRIFTH